MLKGTNQILILSVCFVLLSGCRTAQIPSGYRLAPREVKKEIAGSWIEINSRTQAGQETLQVLSGELIAIQNDTLYILTSEQLTGIASKKVNEAILYIFTSRAGTLATITSLVFVPDIVGAIVNRIPGFLILGIPWIVSGSIFTGFELGDKSNLLIYPDRNRLSEFTDFTRFPKGIPPEVDRSKLHLITNKQGRSE